MMLAEIREDRKYYVYSFLREDGTPYYIGKGSGFRAYCKRRYRPSDKSRITIIKEDLTEKEAFDLECELISKYGREDLGTGILKNKTDGGDGPSLSEEIKGKISKAMQGKPTWNKGLTKSDPRILKTAISRSKVRYSEETLKSFRKPKSDQGKINMSIGQTGKKYPKKPCSSCGKDIPTNAMASHMRKHNMDARRD